MTDSSRDDQLPPPTCLSSDQHEIRDVRDFLCHFMGCIPIEDRLSFLDRDDVWKHAANGEGLEAQLKLRYTTAMSLEAELKRIDILRHTPELSDLVENVNSSCEVWRRHEFYAQNIRRIALWNSALALENKRSWHGAYQGQDMDEQCKGLKGADGAEPSWGLQLPSEPVGTAGPRMPFAVRQLTLPSMSPAAAPSRAGSVVSGQRTAVPRQPLPAGALEPPAAEGLDTLHPAAPVKELSDGEKSHRKVWSRLRIIIRDYRIYAGHKNSEEQDKDDVESPPPYSLERDTKSQFMKFERKELTAKDGHPNALGVMVPADEPVHDAIFKGSFPDQELSIEKLLGGEFARREADADPDDPEALAKDREYPREVRYFHIPCNNMTWVERAIERYFHKSDRDTRRRANLLLHADCWKRQAHSSGADNIVHSRHLRSLCERFSTEPDLAGAEHTQTNMVLFMPFLHWETDRMRSMMTEGIEEQADKAERKGRIRTRDDRKNRIESRKPQDVNLRLRPSELPPLEDHTDPDYYVDRVDSDAIPRTIEDVLWSMVRDRKYTIRPTVTAAAAQTTVLSAADSQGSRRTNRRDPKEKVKLKPTHIFFGVPRDAKGRLSPIHPLAQYLIDAARLFEAMATFRDRRILEDYLFRNPPLHPRRTLDQAYFWRLRTTRRRDKDQVVFRFTRADLAHKLRRKQDVKRQLKSEEVDQNTPQLRSQMEGWEWTGHGEYEDKNGCEQCLGDIRKVSRAIMVDQLWMWILDRDTILTCFPQRYGILRKDPSGLHQSIRTRLKDQSNPLRSVFDLGLLILEESFDVLCNKIKTEDKRPQVLDIFGESIGKVTNKQTIAFRHLWQLTEDLSKFYQSPINEEIPDRLVTPLLNMTPEGRLQQEIRDIIDELDVMIHIVNQQEDVINKYIASAKDILGIEVTRSFRIEFTDIRIYHDGSLRLVERTKPDGAEIGAASSGANEEDQIKAQQQKSFDKRSAFLLAKVADRKRELDGLKASALSTNESVNNLISLKQQQASVVQAYQAMKQGEETVNQGRAIMLFTVMTIIFLPLSFMTSLFGMNALELTGSSSGNSSSPPALAPDQIANFWPVTFTRQLAVMFPVSFGVVVFSMYLAYSPKTRAALLSRLDRLWVNVKVHAPFWATPWYQKWLFSQPPISIDAVKTRKMKNQRDEDKAHRDVYERRRQARFDEYNRDASTYGTALPPLAGGVVQPNAYPKGEGNRNSASQISVGHVSSTGLQPRTANRNGDEENQIGLGGRTTDSPPR